MLSMSKLSCASTYPPAIAASSRSNRCMSCALCASLLALFVHITGFMSHHLSTLSAFLLTVCLCSHCLSVVRFTVPVALYSHLCTLDCARLSSLYFCHSSLSSSCCCTLTKCCVPPPLCRRPIRPVLLPCAAPTVELRSTRHCLPLAAALSSSAVFLHDSVAGPIRPVLLPCAAPTVELRSTR